MSEGAIAPALIEATTRLETFRDRLAAIGDSPSRVGWECDRTGRVTWTEGQGGPAHGEPLADFAPDSPIRTAFLRRKPFRLVERGIAISGVPFFDDGGRFLGYRGTRTIGARQADPDGLFETGASAETFARLAHEVRTPLTAIMGFAQMIEAETLGAASPDYCERATAIVESATRLLDAVDDIADAAQLEQGRYAVEDGRSDIAAILSALVEDYRALATRASVILAVLPSGPLPEAAIDERLVTRALARTFACLVAVARDELLTIGARRDAGDIEILLSRPAALMGFTSSQLLDPAQPVPVPGGSGPLLGLGFGLRLAERLIRAVGGRFAIDPESIRIRLPGIAKRDHIA